MALREPALEQPKSFEFSKEAQKRVKEIIAKYPKGRQQSAVLPLLDIAQRECGNWVPVAAMEHIAELLDMPYIRVYEVTTFYSMFNLAPVGKHFVQVCRTTPCWLRGSDAITKACLKRAGTKKLGENSADGNFTIVEVECLGACVNAPMVQINDDYYEDLTPEQMAAVMDDLAAGKKPAIGTQIARQNSAPVGGATVLKAVPKTKPAVKKAVAPKKATKPAEKAKAAVKKAPVKKPATAAAKAKTTTPKKQG